MNVALERHRKMKWMTVLAHLLVVATCLSGTSAKYYGKLIGELKTNAHGVKGTVYAANKNTFYIVGFEYDGQGPDAFFWGGSTPEPSEKGFIIPDEKGSKEVLKKYNKQDIIITLPDGKTIKDIAWLSVWCRMFTVDFGSVKIPEDLVLPQELTLGPFPSFAHGLRSGNIIIKDIKTVYIPNLFYDGAAPDAFFLVGKGSQPHSSTGIKVPDENGSLQRLQGYQGKNIMLKLPGELTFKDVNWLSMYCITFEENFGHVQIPHDLNVPAVLPTSESIRAEKVISPATALAKSVYKGKYIGPLKTNAHEVKGEVYAASDNTFYIENFSYDGQGPKGYFWAGTTPQPSAQGFIVPDELGTKEVLGAYTDRNIAITLPDGKKMKDIKWLSVWCEKFSVDFGSIMIPENLQPPQEQSLGSLSSLAHGVRSGPVIIKDSKTIFISKLYYDGAGPDAFFLVGKGDPNPMGTKVPDENGRLEKLKGYTGKDITLRLPGNLTVFDIEWFALYCIQFTENFGNVKIPKNLNVPPDMQALTAASSEFENCEEIFPDKMQVRWKIVEKDLYVQLTGKVGNREYMAFGRSGNDDAASMIGSDVVLVFYDKTKSQAQAVDYFLTAKGQCSSGSGVCPDTKFGGTEDSKIVHSYYNGGILKVTYKKPLSTGDAQDLSFPATDPVTIVAAIGPLNSLSEAAYHSVYYTKQTIKITFGRKPPVSNCGTLKEPEIRQPKIAPWRIPKISNITEFRAQIGPAGGDRGYTAITGLQSWGIAWWINGVLIPELVVERGKNYTFIVEGGNDPTKSASYHPLYITNNAEGGGSQDLGKIGSDSHKTYAGVETDDKGNVKPIGHGRYCEWKHKTIDMAENSTSFEAYKQTLKLKCDDGEPGKFVWTPDDDTPDLVYYQCFTHRNLGWKIHVTSGSGISSETMFIATLTTFLLLLMILSRY